MSALRRTLLAFGAMVALSGCKNECQKLCGDIADFAETECGQEFPKEELKACVSANKSSALAEGADEVCGEIRPFLTEEWTCEEINEYFDAPAGGTGGGTDGTGATDGTGDVDTGS